MTTAIYETFVRMSQPFTNNVPEVDFHGANGNIILGGDSFAADRYTEARLAKITEEGMLCGIEKQNVPMISNFSEDEKWPKVLPAVFPRLLVNGAQGIGVSVANYWTLHNFSETADLILHYIETGELQEDTYYPDFPTGGTIVNKDELTQINKAGKGRVIVEANYRIEGREIIFYEMPYQVYIEPVIEKIKEAIESQAALALENIVSVTNKSDKKRIALVIECRKGADFQKVVDALFDTTPLRSQYNVNQNGIVSKTPVLLKLQEVVDIYVTHNTECIRKEHEYDFGQLRMRVEILQGLTKALASIEEIIELIRKSKSVIEAKQELISRYNFTEPQAKAILDMKLSRLSNLEGVAIQEELEEKEKQAAYCKEVIESQDKQKEILVQRLSDLAKKYGTPRRTKVEQKIITKTTKAAKKKEEVIEDCIIAYNPLGYLQRITVTNYRANGFSSFKTTTADLIILFSNLGKFYRILPKDIKPCGIKDKGTAIGAIVKLENGEKIIGVFSTEINEKRPYILFAMANGMIKKTEKVQYLGSTRNLNGMVATKLVDTEVVSVQETNGNDIVLTTQNKYQIRFSAEEVRASGKASLGVKGIALQDNDIVVKCDIIGVNDKPQIAKQKRAGKGKKC